jgi:hypothetical protein
MRTNYTFQTNWDITLLAVGLTSLVGVKFTLRKSHFSVFERNDVMRQGVERLYVFVDTLCTQTDLTVVTELPGWRHTEFTQDDLLCLGRGHGHCVSLLKNK